jgi:hypothetical protein
MEKNEEEGRRVPAIDGHVSWQDPTPARAEMPGGEIAGRNLMFIAMDGNVAE